MKVELGEYMRVVNAQLTLTRKNSVSESQWPAMQLNIKVKVMKISHQRTVVINGRRFLWRKKIRCELFIHLDPG